MDSAILYELVGPIRDILMREWDPIGVAEIPEAADEYDSYIPRIVELLQEDPTAQELAVHLDSIASGPIGLTPNRARSSAAAAELLLLWRNKMQLRS